MACLQIFLIFFEVIVSIKRKSTSLTGLKIRASSALALRSASEGLYLICLEGLSSGYEFLFKKELPFSISLDQSCSISVELLLFCLTELESSWTAGSFCVTEFEFELESFSEEVLADLEVFCIRTCNDK